MRYACTHSEPSARMVNVVDSARCGGQLADRMGWGGRMGRCSSSPVRVPRLGGLSPIAPVATAPAPTTRSTSVITSRDAPDRVAANRARVAAEIGVAPSDLRFMSQVHGAQVAHVGREAASTRLRPTPW